MIRFVGLANAYGAFNDKAIKSWFPYNVEIDDNDLVINEERDKDIGSAIRCNNKSYDLKNDNYESLADDFMRDYLSPVWEEEYGNHPQKSEITANCNEALSNIKKIRNGEKIDNSDPLDYINKIFMWSEKNQLKERLTEDILPYLHDIGMKHVCFTIANDKVWPIISILKAMYMGHKFGPDMAKKNIIDGRALSAILPSDRTPLLLLDGFINFNPIYISLPLGRGLSQMHCLGESLLNIAANKQMDSYDINRAIANPFQKIVRQNGIGLNLGNGRNEKYLFTCIDAINTLYSYFLNLSVYKNDDDTFNFEKFIKALSSFQFLTLDLVELNKNKSDYVKFRLVFSFIDKMANLRCHMKGEKQNETMYFHKYLSRKTGETCAGMLKDHFSGQDDEELGSAMYNFAKGVWESIHAEITETSGKPNRDEEFVTEMLRNIRNTHHGGFLKNNNFEKAFLTGAPKMPIDIQLIPLILMLCLALEPEYFFDHI